MTVRAGWIASHTPMLWVIGCVVTLAMGGLTGVLVTYARADRVLHNTYFVVAHLQYMFGLAMVFGFFAAWYYLFPKLTGYAYSDRLGGIHFWSLSVGVIITLVPQILLFLFLFLFLFTRPAELLADAAVFRYWNPVSRIGSYISGASTLVFFANMVLRSSAGSRNSAAPSSLNMSAPTSLTRWRRAGGGIPASDRSPSPGYH